MAYCATLKRTRIEQIQAGSSNHCFGFIDMRHARRSSAGVLPIEKLRKGHLAALAVLSHHWPTQMRQPCKSGKHTPVTGSTYLTVKKISPCTFFEREDHWLWAQSHRRMKTHLFGQVISIQKYSPKRSKSADSNSHLPSHKVWLLCIGDVPLWHFIWVERGAHAAPSVLPCHSTSGFP